LVYGVFKTQSLSKLTQIGYIKLKHLTPNRNGLKSWPYTAVVSHRSGETEDSTIADIAVCNKSGQI